MLLTGIGDAGTSDPGRLSASSPGDLSENVPQPLNQNSPSFPGSASDTLSDLEKVI